MKVETLQDHVQKHGSLLQTEVKKLAKILAEALQHANDNGVIHRDVKPANVLVNRTDDEWKLCLIDFGLAKYQQRVGDATSTLSHAGSVTGTIDYAPPEQLGKISVSTVDWRADVYGFGRTWCYALFGTPNPVAEHWEKLTPTYRKWLSACIHEQPEDRPASWDKVLQLIHKAVPKPPKKPAILSLRLVVLRGLHTGAEYPLEPGENLVGRSDEPLQINLEGQEPPDRIWSSRQHALITLSDKGAFIRDLGSSNGTRLNGERLENNKDYQLKENDVLQIGSVQLQVREGLDLV